MFTRDWLRPMGLLTRTFGATDSGDWLCFCPITLTRLRLGLTPPAGLTVEQGTHVLMSWPSHGTSCHSQTCQKHINNQEKDYLATPLTTEQTLNTGFKHSRWMPWYALIAGVALHYFTFPFSAWVLAPGSKANKAGTCSMFAICLDPSESCGKAASALVHSLHVSRCRFQLHQNLLGKEFCT